MLEKHNNSIYKNIIGFEKLPNINISLRASHVDALELERLILKCTGYKLTENQKYFEIKKKRPLCR
jgi:hypothetical protein